MDDITAEYSLDGFTTWFDFTSALIGTSPIPIIQRNNDYSLSTKGFDLIVSEPSTSELFAAAKRIRIKRGSSILFVGDVVKTHKEHRTMRFERAVLPTSQKVYKITVDYSLAILQSIIIDYPTLNDLIIAHSEYKAPVGYKPTISLQGLIDVLIKSASGSNWGINYSYISDSVVNYDKGVVRNNDIPLWNVVYREIKFKHLRIPLDVLWCLGQDYAVGHLSIDNNDITDYDAETKKISAFDLLSFICQIFSLRLQLSYSDAGGWILYRDELGNNNDKESYDFPRLDAYSNKYFFGDSNYKWYWQIKGSTDGTFAPYSGTIPTDVVNVFTFNSKGGSEENGENLGWINNLLLVCQAQSGDNGSDGIDGKYYYSPDYLMWNNFILPRLDRNMLSAPNRVGDRIINDKMLDRNELTETATYDSSYINFKNVLRNELLPYPEWKFRVRRIG